MEVFILMQVRRKELTNERRTRAWQNCIEGNIIKADTAYISRVANYFPAIFAWRIIYAHHMIDAVTAVDNHSIYLNWFHWLLLLL